MVANSNRTNSTYPDSVDEEPCSPNPCDVSATCIPRGGEAYCQCPGEMEIFQVGTRACHRQRGIVTNALLKGTTHLNPCVAIDGTNICGDDIPCKIQRGQAYCQCSNEEFIPHSLTKGEGSFSCAPTFPNPVLHELAGQHSASSTSIAGHYVMIALLGCIVVLLPICIHGCSRKRDSNEGPDNNQGPSSFPSPSEFDLHNQHSDHSTSDVRSSNSSVSSMTRSTDDDICLLPDDSEWQSDGRGSPLIPLILVAHGCREASDRHNEMQIGLV